MENNTVENQRIVEGLLIFYINLGNLPPFKAEAHMDRIKESLDMTNVIKRFKKVCEVIWIPVSDGSTRVEYISFDK
jgi:hypothetical protein